jgi:hypothetical protein
MLARGRIARSEPAKHTFESSHPCPATGKSLVADYVVDHMNPLACGGGDDPGNMQWQTTAEAKAKDAWERKGILEISGSPRLALRPHCAGGTSALRR